MINERAYPLKKAIQKALRRMGYNLHKLGDDERAAFERYEAAMAAASMTGVFGDLLPRLQELRRRYATVKLPVAVHSIWAGDTANENVARIGWGGIDLRNFRAHNAYVWDYVGANIQAGNLRYYLYADDLHRRGDLGLLERLKEDGAFGCFTYEHPRFGPLSRDLLDSVSELVFLERHTGVLSRPGLRVLDIGAGYGRMAHRMLEAQPQLGAYTCVDAVPESTFLCEFYLQHRGLLDRARVLALDELESGLTQQRYDLALNIHSFSECTYAAVEWWLTRVRELEIPQLLIVPNHPTALESRERDGSTHDFRPLLEGLGYHETACEPVFEETALQSLIGVTDRRYLFRLGR